jgi:adenosylcobinamide-phosphate synthase
MKQSAINALIADIIAGEPPESIHPTVWMGKWLAGGRTRHTRRLKSARVLTRDGAERDIMTRKTARRRNTMSFTEGALLLGGGVAIAALSAGAVQRVLRKLPKALRETANGFALKPTISLRPLIAAARRVQYALEDGNLAQARTVLGRDLVSGDTSELTEDEVAGAAIESVAGNLSDSVVAPLLAYRVGGLGAAYAYRLVNTADAMLGYHTDELEWFGKAAARADDVANFIPSRVTAALICAAATSGAGSPRHALRVARRDANLTQSPNAGWPMAAMAGALDVRLTKSGQYELNSKGYTPIPRDIARACRIALTVSAIFALTVDVL